MRRMLLLVLAFVFITANALAIEVARQKNVATILTFPIMKNDGTLITSAAGLDSEIDTWANGSAPDGFTDCTNEATEIGSTGQYYLSLSQAECNVDYAIIQTKSSTTGAVTQTMLIRFTVGNPANMATTDDGGTINVTGGAIDTVTTTTTATTTTTLTNAPGDSSGVTTLLSRLSATRAGYLDNLTNLDAAISTRSTYAGGAVASVTGAVGSISGVSFPTNFSALSISASTGLVDITQVAADKVWGTTARALTDKAGFALSAASIDAIWDEAQSGHTSAGTFGKYLDAQVSAVGGGTAAAIADAVWDEAISGHLTSGTTGAALNAAGSAGDPWSTSYPGAYASGTFGYTFKKIKQQADLIGH